MDFEVKYPDAIRLEILSAMESVGVKSPMDLVNFFRLSARYLVWPGCTGLDSAGQSAAGPGGFLCTYATICLPKNPPKYRKRY